MKIEKDKLHALIALVVLVCLFVAGLWWPRKAREDDLRKQISDYQRQLGYAQEDSEGLTELHEDVIRLQAVMNQSQRDVPQKHDVAALLQTFSTLFQTYQIDEHEIQIRSINEGSDYNEIPLSIRCRGPFVALFGFIDQVESMQRLVRINGLTLDGDPQGVTPMVDVRIELDTFSLGSGSQQQEAE